MKLNIKSAVVAVALTGMMVLATASGAKADGSHKCSNFTLNGTYSATITGTVAGLPFAELDLVTSTGNGTFTGRGTQNFNDEVIPVTITATYTVNSNCSGSATLNVSGTTITQNLNIKSDGSEVMFISTVPGATVTGDAKQVSGGQN